MPSLSNIGLDRSGVGHRMQVWADLHRTTKSALAKSVGVSRQVVQSISEGRYRSGDTLESVAKAMGSTVGWLLYGQGAAPSWWPSDAVVDPPQASPSMQVESPKVRDLEHQYGAPTASIGWAGEATAGGGYTEASQDPADWVPVPIKPHWRLVRVKGTSAVPVLLPGQAAIVDDTVPIKDGRLVCVQTHDGRCYIKRWNTVGDHVVLAGINGGHESTVLRREEIAAKAVVVGTLYVDSVVR